MSLRKRSEGKKGDAVSEDAGDAAAASETWTEADDRAATPDPPAET